MLLPAGMVSASRRSRTTSSFRAGAGSAALSGMSESNDLSGLGTGFRGVWDGPAPSFVIPDYDERESIAERFRKFDEANPWIAEALVRLARDWVVRHGDDARIGIKMLFEVLRWQWHMSVVDTGEPYRLNNDFTSRYARKIMEEHSDLEGVFETRRLRAA